MARNGSANAFSNMLILSKILSKQQKIYKPYELLPSHSLFFKFNPFWVNVPRKFRDFCVVGEHIETSQLVYFADYITWLVSLWATWFWGTLDFRGILAQIGLMYLLDRLDILSKDVIKSWAVWGRQFWEYN